MSSLHKSVNVADECIPCRYKVVVTVLYLVTNSYELVDGQSSHHRIFTCGGSIYVNRQGDANSGIENE